jgi:hypothetical protein
MQAELRQNLEMVDFYNKPSILISALKSITPSLQSNNMTDYFFLKEEVDIKNTFTHSKRFEVNK